MVRAKIQASVIIRRLHDCLMGKVALTSEQIRAAQILLAKSVPDLQRTEHSGPDGGAVVIRKTYWPLPKTALDETAQPAPTEQPPEATAPAETTGPDSESF
jgi:hypothetical protein